MIFALHRTMEGLHCFKMASNISIENSIKSRKEEQAKIHDSIQLCTEIINVYTSQQRLPLELDSEKNLPADTPLVAKEEIDLLEKALEKALQVRSGSKPSVTRFSIAKPPGTQNEQGASTKDTLSTYKPLTKSKSLSKTIERKQQNEAKITHGNVTSNKVKALPVHGEHTLPCGSKKQKMKSAHMSAKNLKAISDFSTNSSVSFSKTVESERNYLFQQKEILKWTNLKRRENRLWDKIIAFDTKSSMSGRDLFMARMRGTFPMRWPCGSPENTQALVHRLIQQGQGLLENRQIGGALVRQSTGDITMQGGGEDSQDSALESDRMNMMRKDIHNFTVQLIREWESWDRWRPEWGCLCSIGIKSDWHEAIPAPLPRTVTYTTKKELIKLETLRMKVALLQQEAFTEKILSDILSPHISSAVCATLNPTLLRDLYSVLGEGGERFPAIVLDSEPDS